LQAMLVEDNDAEGFYQADEEFHALLMEFTGFPGVAAAVATISLKLKRPRMLLLPTPGRSADAVREHLAIVEAVRDRDAEEARAAMRYHLRQLIGRFDPLEVNHPEFFRMRQAS
jgi:GntR family transcriptional regulator, rspAB operon transcriptional repressor